MCVWKRGGMLFFSPWWGGVMQFYHLGMGGGSTVFFLLWGAVCQPPSAEIYEQSLTAWTCTSIELGLYVSYGCKQHPRTCLEKCQPCIVTAAAYNPPKAPTDKELIDYISHTVASMQPNSNRCPMPRLKRVTIRPMPYSQIGTFGQWITSYN